MSYKKRVFDKNILTNISISTKQLESIYKSLTYLNFSEQTQEAEIINLAPILTQIIRYYSELSDAKHIRINADISELNFIILDTRAELLFSNLLSNAIKYSMPETSISITLKEEYFLIKDESVGIKKEKLGVGLSIVKQICDEYGIKVEVDSEIGKGSEFKLYFK